MVTDVQEIEEISESGKVVGNCLEEGRKGREDRPQLSGFGENAKRDRNFVGTGGRGRTLLSMSGQKLNPFLKTMSDWKPRRSLPISRENIQ